MISSSTAMQKEKGHLTDTQIHDRFKEILREELGDVLRNKEVGRVTTHRIVDKVISAMLGRAEEKAKAGARAAGQGGDA